MLVLTRKRGERILIGGQVEVTVLKVSGSRVKLELPDRRTCRCAGQNWWRRMMKPTDVFVDEHRLVEQVLNCLERMADQSDRLGTVDRQAVGDAVTFFRTFVDGWHFPREEAYLAAAIAASAKEAKRHGPPFHDHRRCRARLGGMAEAARATSTDGAPAAKRFAEHARAYIDALMKHIEDEEDDIFAAIAAGALLDEDARAAEVFGRPVHGCVGRHQVDACIDVANRLADRFGVPRADLSHLSKPA